MATEASPHESPTNPVCRLSPRSAEQTGLFIGILNTQFVLNNKSERIVLSAPANDTFKELSDQCLQHGCNPYTHVGKDSLRTRALER